MYKKFNLCILYIFLKNHEKGILFKAEKVLCLLKESEYYLFRILSFNVTGYFWIWRETLLSEWGGERMNGYKDKYNDSNLFKKIMQYRSKLFNKKGESLRNVQNSWNYWN